MDKNKNENSSLAVLSGITKKFKGMNMAKEVVTTALLTSAKKQMNQISLENEHLENIKQSFGFDMVRDEFVMNHPVEVFLKPRGTRGDRRDKLSMSRAKIVQNVYRHPEIR